MIIVKIFSMHYECFTFSTAKINKLRIIKSFIAKFFFGNINCVYNHRCKRCYV